MLYELLSKSDESVYEMRSLSEVSLKGNAFCAFVTNLLSSTKDKVQFIVVSSENIANRISHDLEIYLDGAAFVHLLPAWETLPFERVSPSISTMGQRIRTIYALDAELDRPLVIVSSIKAALQVLSPSRSFFKPIKICIGSECDPVDLVDRLVELGYTNVFEVEAHGEVSMRGGIVDIFPPLYEYGLRIEFQDDDVENIRKFDIDTQLSYESVNEVSVFGAREFLVTDEISNQSSLLSEKLEFLGDRLIKLENKIYFDGLESFLPLFVDERTIVPNLLKSSARLILYDTNSLKSRAEEVKNDETELVATLMETWNVSDYETPNLHVDFDELFATDAEILKVNLSQFNDQSYTFESSTFNKGIGEDDIIKEIMSLRSKKFTIIIFADSEASGRRLEERLQTRFSGFEKICYTTDFHKGMPDGIYVTDLDINESVVLDKFKLALISQSSFSSRRQVSKKRHKVAKEVTNFFEELDVTSYVVHRQHGIAKYSGVVTRSIGGIERDYLLLEYRGNDKLYLPVDAIDAITPYSSGDTPTLSRMGGADFARTTSKARASAAKVATELVELYKERVVTPGHAFSPDPPYMTELIESFEYQETRDQLRAIRDVTLDMERAQPMDRLVCGDVGFGKTEVAIRAVFKAVLDGYQAAVLVPTTLLANQHFDTFSSRYSSFPINVKVLSRFLSDKEAKETVLGIRSGEIDVVIGTHKLIQEGVKFNKLGLLVIDEEQRFGVSHKEAMKKFSVGVDVLTLSASPIPRTLEMSLTGIRDISLIKTPPIDRQPILTYVGEYDDMAVSEAIRRELLREGQVFYVHNRIKDIDKTAQEIGKLVPNARVVVAHGQMDENTLEKVVIDFCDRKYDVLVSTTIIESGIDITNVNTLIVDRADRLGLGQLHQLRGRVGRSGRKAYAYLFYPGDVKLSESAYERLRTIGEETELGSGFRLAMKDLEIRGAGSLLGQAQSGHIQAVGYDLYVSLVHEAVEGLKGVKVEKRPECTVDLSFDAFIPKSYIRKDSVRLEVYRNLMDSKTESDVDDVLDGLLDRFGKLPIETGRLLKLVRLKNFATEHSISEIVMTSGKNYAFDGVKDYKNRNIRVEPIKLKASSAIKLKRLASQSKYYEDTMVLELPVSTFTAEKDIVDSLFEFLKEILS